MKEKDFCLKAFDLPKNFLIGTATASAQIEGGFVNSDWNEWEKQGKIKDKSSICRADNHWEKWEEDFLLMKKMDMKIYRLSLEWARIQPDQNTFDEQAVAVYAKMLERLAELEIKPLVTLHHFTQPRWFFDLGGFENPSSPTIFEKYVRFVVGRLGKLCDEWCTINEPNVHAAMGYYFGEFPPGKKSMRSYFAVMRNQAIAHIAAYKTIHELREEYSDKTMVGSAHHIRVIKPFCPVDPIGATLAAFFESGFNKFALDSTVRGVFGFPIGGKNPFGKGKYSDFLGLNYYSTLRLAPNAKEKIPSGAPINDLGWEIYPFGLFSICKKYSKEYGLPIYITENGTCDNLDAFRARFVAEHLFALKCAIDEGADVQRFYHWTFLDNFEWCEGESARFGIVHNDYETQTRTLKKSGELFCKIAAFNSFDEKDLESVCSICYNTKK